MKQTKCLEYYLDSKLYTNKEVLKNIEETKKQFPKKKIQVNYVINDFGMYIITFYFENRNTIFNKMKLYLKKRSKNTLLLQEKNIKSVEKEKRRLEKYYGHKYGEYKNTGVYKPYKI